MISHHNLTTIIGKNKIIIINNLINRTLLISLHNLWTTKLLINYFLKINFKTIATKKKV